MKFFIAFVAIVAVAVAAPAPGPPGAEAGAATTGAQNEVFPDGSYHNG